MEQLLGPWLARADALLPRWRDAVRDNDAISIAPSSLLTNGQQLRETLELLARALVVDAPQVTALACGAEEKTHHRATHYMEPMERLRLRLHLDSDTDTPNGSACFQEWSEDVASDSFRETKTRLAALAHGRIGHTPLDLQVELRLLPSSPSSVGGILSRLAAVDGRAFNVTQIRIAFATADLEAHSFTALMDAVNRFTQTANVKIHLQLSPHPSLKADRLVDWKRIFDATLRRQPSLNSANAWDIVVSMDDLTGETDGRVVAACFSALAHAGDHVTSIELLNPLGASNGKDLYNPTDRRARAKWLGYLLRVGKVQRLTIQETKLSQDDMDKIALTLQAPTEERCLHALWNEHWHRGRHYDVEPKPQCDEDSVKAPARDNLQHFTEDDIVGIMQDPDDIGDAVDVLVVGYGQCAILRSVAAQLDEKKHSSATSKTNSSLTSLRICLSEGEGTEGHLLRLVMLLGTDLEELVIDTTHSRIALSILIVVLASCPRLKRLTVKSIYLNVGDDEQMFLPTHWANHPLEELSVDVHLNEASIGLCGLASMLVSFGVQLKTLRVHADPPTETNHAARSAIQKMLQTCCKSLCTLEVVGLSFEYFQDILTPDALGLHHLGTLVLSDAASDRVVWLGLMTALTLPTHPLTLSLHTLRIHVQTVPEIAAMAANMLDSNVLLVNCQLVCPSETPPPQSLYETHGRTLRRRKAPLSLGQKVSFLSSVQRSVLPWESSVLGQIFKFAASTEKRRVVVSTV